MRTSSVVAGHAGGYSFSQFRGPICQHTGRSVAAFVLLILVALICGCGGSDIATQRPPLDLAGPMNVTFFVTSDVHCSNGPLPLPARAGIQAMNGHVAGLPDPADAGTAIQKAAFAVTL